MWNFILICFKTLSALVQDRSTVCTKHTIGSEIILDAPDGTPSWRGLSGSSIQFVLETVLVLVQDMCTVCAEHTTGSQIILDAYDGTARW
jgi:hypothetical protein